MNRLLCCLRRLVAKDDCVFIIWRWVCAPKWRICTAAVIWTQSWTCWWSNQSLDWPNPIRNKSSNFLSFHLGPTFLFVFCFYIYILFTSSSNSISIQSTLNLGTRWLIGARRFWPVTVKTALHLHRPVSWFYPNVWNYFRCTSIVCSIATPCPAVRTWRSTTASSTCTQFKRCTSVPVWLTSTLVWSRCSTRLPSRTCCLRPFAARSTRCATTASTSSITASTCFCGSDCLSVPNGFTASLAPIQQLRLTLTGLNWLNWTILVLKRFVEFFSCFYFRFSIYFCFGLVCFLFFVVRMKLKSNRMSFVCD